MTHKQVLQHYELNPSEIELGMVCLFREYHIGHLRVDLLMRDKNHILTIVEVNHKQNKSRKQVAKQLKGYRANIRMAATRLFNAPNHFKIRMLLVKPGSSIEEIPTLS